jgi:urea transport system permease protein
VLSTLIDSLFSGISIGSVLLLAALGLAIIFGLMGVINMAHGELMMLGAYTTVMVQGALKETPLASFYIFFALVAAFFVTAGFGLLLERCVVRYLYGRPLETLLATWGVSLILQQFVRSISWQFLVGIGLFTLLWFFGRKIAKGRLIWLMAWLAAGLATWGSQVLGEVYKLAFTKPWFGAQNQDVTAPLWLRGGLKVSFVPNLQLSYARIFIIGLTIVSLALVYWFLHRTDWGLRIRAVTQNREMSACLGIPTKTVDALTFAIGSGLAGIAGCAVGLLGSVGPNIGQTYIVDTFMVVVVGGVGKLAGSILAAMAIGVANYLIGSNILVNVFGGVAPLKAFFEFFSTISMAKVLVFALIVVFLQFRPGGLFPQKGRTVDA